MTPLPDSRRPLAADEARAAFDLLLDGRASDDAARVFLTDMAERDETSVEIAAASQALRDRMIPVRAPAGAIDVCGTGGDGSHSLNVSTAVAIVVAACGVPVAKHGNRAASSKSGSADVLEALGVKLDISADVASTCVRDANLCFAFARSHHPAMKHVAPVRAGLGIPTIFNLLGPLTNPARAPRQLMGVFRRDLTELMAAALLDLGATRAWVVHADDGMDELSTLGPTHVVEVRDGALNQTTIVPAQLGLATARIDELRADTPSESASIIRNVLAGKAGPPADIVALNAAAGLVIAGRADDLRAALALARDAMATGAAKATLDKLVAASHAVARATSP